MTTLELAALTTDHQPGERVRFWADVTGIGHGWVGDGSRQGSKYQFTDTRSGLVNYWQTPQQPKKLGLEEGQRVMVIGTILHKWGYQSVKGYFLTRCKIIHP